RYLRGVDSRETGRGGDRSRPGRNPGAGEQGKGPAQPESPARPQQERGQHGPGAGGLRERVSLGVRRYENARATARNVIASAVANRVARNQAIQTLADMIIRVPKPELTPPGSSQADAVVYAVTKRSVSEGQMVREGEAVCELI